MKVTVQFPGLASVFYDPNIRRALEQIGDRRSKIVGNLVAVLLRDLFLKGGQSAVVCTTSVTKNRIISAFSVGYREIFTAALIAANIDNASDREFMFHALLRGISDRTVAILPRAIRPDAFSTCGSVGPAA